MDAIQNFLGIENNQVLIREYEIIGTDFEFLDPVNLGEGGRFVGVRFRKYPHEPDDTNKIRFIIIITLKEYFIHLLEEPVDTATWLKLNSLELILYILISSVLLMIIIVLIIILFHLSYTQETR